MVREWCLLRVQQQRAHCGQHTATPSLQADTGIQFKLSSIDRITNPPGVDWYGNCRELERQYKTKYVREPTKYIYVFVCGSGSTLGWATLASRQPETDKMNALVIQVRGTSLVPP